ncbi:endospore germination permease [Bacillus sp. RO3]|nr:endospore germination permease [Bacillus sp. RO3]
MDNQVEKISSRQFQLLVLFFAIGSSILLTPPALINASLQDGWISGIIGVALGLSVIYIYVSLIKLNPGLSWFSILEKAFGTLVGRVISIFYFLFLFFLTCEVLSNLGDFMVTQIMVETPKMYIHMLFLIPVAYGVKQGIEVIARSAEVIYPTFIILLVFLVIFLIPEGQLVNLEPILGEGMKPVVKGALSTLTVPYMEMFALILISTYVVEQTKIGKSFLVGGLAGGIILISLTFLIILVLGYSFSSHLPYPTYVLAKKINIADFLQRVEVVAAAVWIMSLFFKVLICFYSTVYGLGEILHVKNHTVLIFPLLVPILYFSVTIYPDIAFFTMFVNEVILSYTLLFGLFIPLLGLFSLKIKNKLHSKQSA